MDVETIGLKEITKNNKTPAEQRRTAYAGACAETPRVTDMTFPPTPASPPKTVIANIYSLVCVRVGLPLAQLYLKKWC